MLSEQEFYDASEKDSQARGQQEYLLIETQRRHEKWVASMKKEKFYKKVRS